jgi:coenzyme PQQ precursor peptide PqqA
MNFMRPESWRGGWAARPRGASIRQGTRKVPAPSSRPARCTPAQGDFRMQWQTPTATDLRFGFEITLYVTAR